LKTLWRQTRFVVVSYSLRGLREHGEILALTYATVVAGESL